MLISSCLLRLFVPLLHDTYYVVARSMIPMAFIFAWRPLNPRQAEQRCSRHAGCGMRPLPPSADGAVGQVAYRGLQHMF